MVRSSLAAGDTPDQVAQTLIEIIICYQSQLSMRCDSEAI